MADIKSLGALLMFDGVFMRGAGFVYIKDWILDK
jgi:hypothetical protein